MHVFLFSAGTAASKFSPFNVTMSAESVNGSIRVTWNTTVPPQCVASATVEFRTSSRGPVAANYTTNDTSVTEYIQTGLQCGNYYYITAVVTGKTPDGIRPTLRSRSVQVHVHGGKFLYCKCVWSGWALFRAVLSAVWMIPSSTMVVAWFHRTIP